MAVSCEKINMILVIIIQLKMATSAAVKILRRGSKKVNFYWEIAFISVLCLKKIPGAAPPGPP